MKLLRAKAATIMFVSLATPVQSQSENEKPLCEAAKTNRVIELVYDQDASKGCLPRLIDVHQLASGKNGKLYMHGWQHHGCTKGRDYESKRIFRLDKIKSVKLIEGTYSDLKPLL